MKVKCNRCTKEYIYETPLYDTGYFESMCDECVAAIRNLPKVVETRKKKARARQLVAWALQNHILKKPKKCDWCNKEVNWIEAHHDDYNKPLLVEWVCKRCHHIYHARKSPKAKREAKLRNQAFKKSQRRYAAQQAKKKTKLAKALLDSSDQDLDLDTQHMLSIRQEIVDNSKHKQNPTCGFIGRV